MNYEEKILSVLEILAAKVDNLGTGQTKIETRLDKIETRLDTVEAGQKRLEKDVHEIKLNVEEIWNDIFMLDKRTEGLRKTN